MRILLMQPYRNSYMPVKMTECLLKLKKLTEAEGHEIVYHPICGAQCNPARNEYMRLAHEGQYDYCFILDDDNPIDPDGLLKLLSHKLDVVGVCIPARRRDRDGNYTLNMFREVKRTWELVEFEKWQVIPTEERILEVDALATSCMLISRAVLNEMHDNFLDKPFEHRIDWYTKEGIKIDIDKLGKDEEVELICNHIWWDMIFCQRLKRLWFKIFVDTSIRWYHLVEDNIIESSDFAI